MNNQAKRPKWGQDVRFAAQAAAPGSASPVGVKPVGVVGAGDPTEPARVAATPRFGGMSITGRGCRRNGYRKQRNKLDTEKACVGACWRQICGRLDHELEDRVGV